MEIYSEERLRELTQEVVETCLAQQGHWVQLNSKHGERNQKEIIRRVSEFLRLMGLHYSVPSPNTRTRYEDKVVKLYGIKVMTEEQLLTWRRDRKLRGTFSERNGLQEPTWIDEVERFK